MTLALLTSGGTYTELSSRPAPTRERRAAEAAAYLAFEMQNPKFDSSGKCTANYMLFQSTAGTTSLLASFLALLPQWHGDAAWPSTGIRR